ncbi:microsomal signal peptidase 12kDa subunit [Pseudohyphozyma bogoriensis]|nr:microsomal signal peptidase 12kDa subunit [Pseudohyphozyma bogoriensis]
MSTTDARSEWSKVKPQFADSHARLSDDGDEPTLELRPIYTRTIQNSHDLRSATMSTDDFLTPYINAFKAKMEARIAMGFFVGFVLQNLQYTFGIFTVGLLGSCVVILPAYPSYNSHPVKWLPAVDPVEKKEAGESKKDL